MIGPALADELDQFARQPIVLLASDYDGTLAPIVDDPTRAFAVPEAVAALGALARLKSTHVAVVSGRSLHDLAIVARLPRGIGLVGSHGSEFDFRLASPLATDTAEHLAVMVHALNAVAALHPGAMVEPKPAGVAFHVRRVASVDQRHALDSATAVAAATAARIRHGKCVVEFSFASADKGQALELLRKRAGADAVLYIGDDQTDEDAFGVLGSADVGVKVGTGFSAAAHRIDDPHEVARLLQRVGAARASWLGSH